ncbi:methionine biosynthesis protein MetW [Bacillus cereus]|uniref:methionine biosynthesis protein MetW n=1 Tax=Bacillus cereus TaxID=1396 RepID=UPI003300E3A5|nr:hypothetical protein [Bacillus cereus]
MLSINRLPFRMADFTRFSWVSDHARAVWEPRIGKILSAWSDIEWLTVSEGIRQCSLRLIAPEQLVDFTKKMAAHGLSVVPVSMQSVSSHPYNNTISVYQTGKPFNYHIVVGKINAATQFKKAYDANNQEEMGKLLGYPECCRRFFQKFWVEEQFIDTTWPMASNKASQSNNPAMIEIDGPDQTNILLRWLGIRAVPHLPCSFYCQPTVEKAEKFIALGKRNGYAAEMAWLTEMLSWPIEWSALHGIAEIKTPIMKILSCTDSTAIKYVVCRKSKNYPAEGARGLVFPFKQPKRRLITESENFFKALSSIGKINKTHSDWYFLNNGFKSDFDMSIAHQSIIELATSILANQPGTIMDLGCGNGALLKKIMEMNTQVVPYGIEKDVDKIANVQQLLPSHTANFVTGDIYNPESLRVFDQTYTIMLLMPGRLLEASSEQVEQLKVWIKEHSSYLLVYAYGDWLKRYGDFAALAEKAGLQLGQVNNNSGLAKFV